MKQWMMQALRLTVTVAVMVAMAYMIFRQREEIGAAREAARQAERKVATAEAALREAAALEQGQRIQLEVLTDKLKARDPSKGVYVICRFTLKPDADLADYTAKTLAVVPTVRAEDGCIFYSLLKDADTDWEAPMKDGHVYWMLEKWESVEALKAHLQTPHMKAYSPVGKEFRLDSTFHVLQEAK